MEKLQLTYLVSRIFLLLKEIKLISKTYNYTKVTIEISALK